MKNLYVVFGGTFNPIHYGHIFSAKNLSKEISIRKIILLPNNLQDTKTVSIIDKLHMIKL
ncbi:MAG: adenylyltransferase/cytidyltransferase family protein, partial [Buchnera aphidicola]|nr:adenylyltransferase/cytidyltransferase family protein [Buchnera aphidicola]